MEKTFDLATRTISDDISGDHLTEVTRRGDRRLRIRFASKRQNLECLKESLVEGRIYSPSKETTLCFSFPRSRSLDQESLSIFGTEKGRLFGFELRATRMLFSLLGHLGAVWSLSESPDSRLLATSSSDGTIRIWELGAALSCNYGVWDFGLKYKEGAELDSCPF